jgi:hypothetical protein
MATTKAKPNPAAGTSDNLAHWLTDARMAEFMGRGFQLKFDVLEHLQTGKGTLAEIARKHGVSKQAAQQQAARAVRIFTKSSGG